MAEDPFFVVKEDVQKSTRSSDALFKRWKELTSQQAAGSISSKNLGELKWTATELTKTLKSIEWDIEDLEDTVSAVEANPGRFDIAPAELESRRNFIKQSAKFLKDMRAAMAQVEADSQKAQRKDLFTSKPSGPGLVGATAGAAVDAGGDFSGDAKASGAKPGSNVNQYNRFAKLDADIEQDNSRFIKNEQVRQQQLVARQDQDLTQISTALKTVKDMSLTIQNELETQDEMLDGLNSDLDNTDNRLKQVLKRVDKVLEASKDKKQTCCIAVLIVIVIVLFALFFAV